MGNETSKLLRWIVPGWVAILSFALFIGGDLLMDPSHSLYQPLAKLIQKVMPSSQIPTTLVLAIAGFPIGFIIYQLYFYVRWNSPFARDGFFPPLVNGRLAELKELQNGISDDSIALIYRGPFTKNKRHWRYRWVTSEAYKTDHVTRWQYLESLVTEILKKLDTNSTTVSLFERYRHLSEMTHVLGAAYVAVGVGFASYLLVRSMLVQQEVVTWFFWSFIVVGIMILALSIEEAESKRFKQSMRMFGDEPFDEGPVETAQGPQKERNTPILSAWVIFLLCGMVFLLNPVFPVNGDLITQFNTIMRYVLFLAAGAVLIWRIDSEGRRWFMGISLAAVAIAILYLRKYTNLASPMIPWGFSGPAIILMITHLILLKNRQNARDDTISFQRYYLFHYLYEVDVARNVFRPPRKSRRRG